MPISRLALRVIAAGWTCFASTFVHSADVPTEPILRIEAGTSTSVANSITTDANGRYVVTQSYDRTARVWDAATGRQLMVLRPPITRRVQGTLYAAAISPDGETVAAGGITPNADDKMQVYLFSRSSGQIVRSLITLHAIDRLAFSPDGNWLAVGGGPILQVLNWRNETDLAPPLSDDMGAGVVSMSWSIDNHLAVSALDATIRLYEVREGSLKKITEATPASQGSAKNVAFSPNGRELAVGFDRPKVLILDGSSLRVLFEPNTDGVTAGFADRQATLESVAWSSDGHELYAGGFWIRPNSKPLVTLVRSWPNAGRGRPIDHETTADGILLMVTLPGRNGGILTQSSSAPYGIIEPSGRYRATRTPMTYPLRSSDDGTYSFPLSADGRKVSMNISDTRYTFDLSSRQLQRSDSTPMTGARTSGLPISDLRGEQPRLNGKPLIPPHSNYVTSLAIAPDGQSFVLGGTAAMYRWDATGKQLWVLGASSTVTNINIPSSNNLAVIHKVDGTFAWIRLTDGVPVLNLFPHPDGKRWVLWTYSGYFDVSPGGEDLIGWHINRGLQQAADFFPASKFRARFYRPDIVDQVIETWDEGKAIQIANGARGTKPESQTSLALTLPPVLELVSSADLSATQSQFSIRYKTRSADDAPVTRVFARVNGLAQPGARRVQVVGADGSQELSVDVPPQDSEIQLFAENRFGTSSAVLVRVKWAGTAAPRAAAAAGIASAPGDFQIQPKLYVLAIGVSAYENKDIPKLTFAAKDAKDFAQALQRQTGKLYKSVEVKVLTDAKANKDDILDALDWLQKQVTQHDVGMLFLSGHGTNDSSLGYVYLPVNSDLNKLKRTAITMADITTTLNSVAGKAVAFLDTCHSGNILGAGQKGLNDITGVINELASAENGVVVFSSSTGRQSSLEDPSWNNGAFTKALVEGIDGKADEMHTGRVTFKMLDVYVTERVKLLTKGKQSPVTQAPGGVNDFPLASLK